jgi:hypothetical protein
VKNGKKLNGVSHPAMPGAKPGPRKLPCPGYLEGREFKPCRGQGSGAQHGQASCPSCLGSGEVTPGVLRELGEAARQSWRG